jgi:hypothetical protein
MMRITRTVGEDSLDTLKLEGRLQGPWVEEVHAAYVLSAAQASVLPTSLSCSNFQQGVDEPDETDSI